jgi:hypothetical protein
MKLLFLDFDGVLNTNEWRELCWDALREPHEYLLSVLVERVNEIVADSKAQVVASTAWRTEYSRVALETFLRQAGATFPLLSTTPFIGGPRGEEISAWLDAASEPVEAFVILDDLPPVEFEGLRHHLIQVNANVGISAIGAQRAKALFARTDRGHVPRTSTTHPTQSRVIL